ncbi:unnamed protein product [Sphenostylis stenocarpa]|uniref:CRM domain-containing protein n=1 Tax=Sphenostylis stenocarpa TaxID=92480 RepID=A0AA86RNP8_9FABA|nr:unnamed protein product [Sphenostylis stenocarpa]
MRIGYVGSKGPTYFDEFKNLEFGKLFEENVMETRKGQRMVEWWTGEAVFVGRKKEWQRFALFIIQSVSTVTAGTLFFLALVAALLRLRRRLHPRKLPPPPRRQEGFTHCDLARFLLGTIEKVSTIHGINRLHNLNFGRLLHSLIHPILYLLVFLSLTLFPLVFSAGFWTFMFSATLVRGTRRGFSRTFNSGRLFWLCCLVEHAPNIASSPTTTSYFRSFKPHNCIHQRTYRTPRHLSGVPTIPSLSYFPLKQRSNIFGSQGILGSCLSVRYISNESVELKTDNDVVRFSLDKSDDINSENKSRKNKKVKMSKKAKLNELRFYRLKAKKKMNSPNPVVRIRYKLEKAKRKETWLIEKLRKYDVPKPPPETFDPEILTEEERHYLKRTVKVICKPCKPGQVHEYAEELARLSKGIVIDIKPNNTIIFYRGKNYVQPQLMSPPNTLSKAKALEKYRFEQSLEHSSQFIERLEKELEEYHQHLAKFRKGKEDTTKDERESDPRETHTITDDETGEEIKFNNIYAYRYMISTIVIGFAYNLLQMTFSIFTVVSGNRVFSGYGGYLFDFFGDKIISYLLISGSAAEFGLTVELRRVLPANPFTYKANVSASLLIIGFLFTSMASIFTSFTLPKKP